MRLPDTHAHLEAEEFDHDRDEVIGRAVAAGIAPILAVGSDLESSRKAVQIAQGYSHVFAAVGLHPHQASRFRQEADGLRELLDEDRVVAVGEIGLDFYRDWVPPEEQQVAFRTQLEWASDRGLPVSIHSRGAENDVLEAIRGIDVVSVLHCYGGTLEIAHRAVTMGCYLSFAGNVTFPKAADARALAASVPPERLLLESDAPVLAPQAHRGRRNEPSYCLETGRALAECRGEPLDILAHRVTQNASDVFNWGNV